MTGLDPETRKEIMDEQNGEADYQQPHPPLEPDDTDSGITRPSFETTPTRESNINYVCPNCGGSFSHFDTSTPKTVPSSNVEDDTVSGTSGRSSTTATSTSDTGTKRCPFCHTECGEFGDSQNTDELIEENETLRDELAEAYEQIDQLQDALEEVESKLQ